MRLIPPGDDERPIDRTAFEELARDEWTDAKAAYLTAHAHMHSLFPLLYEPGQVQVSGRVTGAAHTAKQLRGDVDRLIEALDAIIRARRRTQ